MALLLGAAAVSCTSTRQVTPWFRVERHRPLMDQPVLIGEETHEVAWLRTGGRWVQVADGRVFATPARDGSAVLFRKGVEWQVARATGEVAPLAVQCSFPALHPNRPAVYCAACEQQALLPPRCRGTAVSELDFSGRVTGVWKGTEPEGADGVTLVGVLPDESVVLAAEWACRLFAVGPDGSKLLSSTPRRDCGRFDAWTDVLTPLGAVRLVTSGENTW